MITPPFNSSDCSAYLLEVVQGEAFNLTVEVSPELPISTAPYEQSPGVWVADNKTIRFVTKKNIADNTYGLDFSTTNGKISVTGQVMTLHFTAADTAEIGEWLCEFWFTGQSNDIRSSGIGKFRVLQPLRHDL